MSKKLMIDGDWGVMSLGEFISTIVDAGVSDVVFVRETGRGEPDGNKEFILEMEVHIVPGSMLITHAAAIGCEAIHGRLKEMIEKGLVPGIKKV